MNTNTIPTSTGSSVNSAGRRTDPAPMDGSWVQAWDEKGRRIIQYDPTAFGGKGGWFNQHGHASKAPDMLWGWLPWLKWADVRK